MPLFVRQQQIEHVIGPTGRFVLRVTRPDVEIRASAEPRATVSVEFELKAGTDAEADQLFERVKYHVHERPDGIEVQEPRPGSGGIGAIAGVLGQRNAASETRVVAEIPATATVTYEGVSGDLDVVGLRGRQEYRSVSGDMQFRDVGGELRIRGVSSDISLRAEGAIGLELNSVSGDVSAIAPRYDALRVTTVSGDVEIEGELSRTTESRIETVSGDLLLGLVGGATIEVRALSSSVSVQPPHRAEGSRDRRRYIIGDGAARVLFSSMSGDLFAREPRRVSPTPPAPPVPPAPPIPPDEQLAILRALERGEISVDEAAQRLGDTGSWS